MKTGFGWIAVGLSSLCVSSAEAGTVRIRCEDVFSTPAFVALDIVTEDNMHDLESTLSPLLGTSCSLQELEKYFINKGAKLDRKTTTNLYFLVTPTTKLLRTGSVRLATSIIVSLDNDVIDFIGSGIAK